MNICRLCLNGCQDSNSLYDESGQANEFYATTFKYFHPQIVNMEVATHLTAICSQCWQHISDFEHFQTSILKDQQADTDSHLKAIKPEAIVSESISLPKLEIMDVESDREFITDVEDSASAPDCNREDNDDNRRVDDLLAKWIPIINCTACPESFRHLTLLKNHFRQHHPNSEFFIVCCSREFSERIQIRDHLLLHDDPNAFTCQLCATNYPTRHSFRQHQRQMHHEYQKFICQVCGAGLGTRMGQKRHYKAVHKMDVPFKQEFQPVESHSTVDHKSDDRSEYICEECGKVFYDEAAHQKHVSHKHKYVAEHKCSTCGGRFKTTLRLREHVAHVHHRRDLYACAFCPKTFRRLTNIAQHRKKMHPHESDINYYHNIDEAAKDQYQTVGESDFQETAEGASLKGDISQADRNVPPTDVEVLNEVDDENIQMQPEVGDAAVTSPGIINSNAMLHMDSITAKYDLKELLAKWIPTIKCVACPASYSNLSLLEDHFRQKHPNEEFFISCCSRKLNNRFSIKEHLIHHDNPTAFACGVCGFFFANKRSLKRHTAVSHHEHSLIVCSICDAGGFKSIPHLKSHMWKSHKHNPRYRCTICSTSFRNVRDLREHVALIHERRDLYACAFCPLTFKKMSTMSQHRKAKHPQESNKNYYNFIK